MPRFRWPTPSRRSLRRLRGARPLTIALALAAALPAAGAARGEAFPSREQVREVRRYLDDRRGVVGFALVDTRGRSYGYGARRVFGSASVGKAMLLVAYLRQAGNRPLRRGERAMLGPMIVRSHNRRATEVYRQVGDAGLVRLARRAGMRDFAPGGYWARARFSASDQARFFRRFDRLTPPRSRRYARRLLSSVRRWQRWGFSRAAERAGWEAFLKAGWRSSDSGRLVHASALFQRGRRRVSVAVLTDGNPSHDYGTATLRGVAARLFPTAEAAQTRRHRRAGLVDIHRFAPGIRLDLRYLTRRNLTGRRLPGYCREWALLRRPAARDLARVQRHLRRRGLGLEVLDAYRPARASRALVRWAERTGRGHLVGTYIARRSNHNKGSAVDLTLVLRRDGRPLRMGTSYDDLSERAHTTNARGRVLRNRLRLVRAMERFGWRNYRREWWHFDHRSGGSRYLDLTLGCEN